MDRLRAFNWRSLRGVEGVLIGLVVVLALFALVSIFRNASASSDVRSLEDRIDRASASLRSIEESSDIAGLQSRLERLRTIPRPRPLPTKLNVLTIDAALFARAADLGVGVTSFNSLDAPVETEGSSFSALSYAVQASGSPDALTGLMRLLEEYPTAVVRELTLTNESGGWTAGLTLAVVYDSGNPSLEGQEES